MKNLLFYFLLLTSVTFVTTSCDDDDDDTTVVDSSLPSGNFSVQRDGDFVAQNGTPTQGMAALGTDADGEQFVRFSSSFRTELATGTVTVYLSKSQPIQFDPGNGNPNVRAIGIVGKNGENFFKVNTPVGNDFTHVILWCGSASIPFGYAPLQ